MSKRRPGEEALLGEQLKNRLAQAGRKGLSRDELITGFDGDAEGALAGLEEAGEAVERSRRWMALRHTPWIAGRLQAMTGGDALIRTGERGEPGYFVAHRHLKGARDGDSVLVEPRKQQRARRGRPAHHLPEAVVVKVSSRRSQVVGRVSCDKGFCRLLPFDPRLRIEVELGADALRYEGRYVVAALEATPGRLSSRARGRVVEVLGRLSEPGVDVLVALRNFEIPEEFPRDVLDSADGLPEDPTEDDGVGREDLRELVTVTIDGETAKDFDDAVTVERLANGVFRLGVHIADVSHYVGEGSALDLEAYRRGTSVYFPDRAVPMLPERLSNGLCSLRPEVPRLVLSAFLDISGEGKVIARRFVEGVIQSDRRLTYTEVGRLLEEPAAEDRTTYGDEIVDLLERSRELMKILLGRRQSRGSIDFDLPEGDVILDTDGVMIGIRPGERTVAHRIVEEFMIAANEAVATELQGHELGAIYRVHEEPDRQRLVELRELLRPLALDLVFAEGGGDGGGGGEVHPSALQDLLRQVEGKPEEAFVATLVLHSMKRAVYLPESLGHYALANEHYTHFTSPIRRYPDLLVHRQLRNLLRGRGVEEDVRTLLRERLPAIADHTSTTERRAERAERLVLQWKILRLLAGREGETFAGRVTGVKEYGLFVRLVEFYADGLVPVEFLSDDFYDFEPERHGFFGKRTQRSFRLADEVTVVLRSVDIHRRMIDLSIEGMPEPPEDARRKRPGSERPRRPGTRGRRRRPTKGSSRRVR
ncbi:MAG: ribonuclease R [Acidobacteriota bacterium]|nr:ribonuclease R [Acidobacteriota bacterium]